MLIASSVPSIVSTCPGAIAIDGGDVTTERRRGTSSGGESSPSCRRVFILDERSLVGVNAGPYPPFMEAPFSYPLLFC